MWQTVCGNPFLQQNSRMDEVRFDNDYSYFIPTTAETMIDSDTCVIVQHKGVNYICSHVDVSTLGGVLFDFSSIEQTFAPAKRGLYFEDNGWYTNLKSFVIEQNDKRYKIEGSKVKCTSNGEVTLVPKKSICQWTTDPITPDVYTNENLYEAMIESDPSEEQIKKYNLKYIRLVVAFPITVLWHLPVSVCGITRICLWAI